LSLKLALLMFVLGFKLFFMVLVILNQLLLGFFMLLFKCFNFFQVLSIFRLLFFINFERILGLKDLNILYVGFFKFSKFVF
jgi:hypothetical protein